MSNLPVPYRSQWDADAQTHDADCGPTCVAMVLNYHGVNISPDRVYDHLLPKGRDEFTRFKEMFGVMKKFNVNASYSRYQDRNHALSELRTNVNAGKPMIALVNYAPWHALTGNEFDQGHFVVVTGYDNINIYVNDPLFGLWQYRSRGQHLAFTHDLLCAGWAGFNGGNPNWACAVIDSVTEMSSVSSPVPPSPELPKPAPVVPPPANGASSETMDDVNRRIRALAAYRRAEAPDFNDSTAVKLWQDHLGDWGLTYERYRVQSGDFFSALAGRFYGEQHRWYAIKAYNNITSDSLWVGQPILIPHVGQSGAHTTTALPSDTVNFAKSLSFEDLVDPDALALDYNALGANTVGMGYMDD